MYTVEDFKHDIDVIKREVVFTYDGANYFISRDIGEDKSGAPIYVFGPDNDEFMRDSDTVLDNLLVGGKPMIERMDEIA